MGYYSEVSLKTTTEGYLVFKQVDDSIIKEDEKPLYSMNIRKTSSGFYNIYNDGIKWYSSFPDVDNFEKVLGMLEDQQIPFSFIRIGEDDSDIECRQNYTDDMPDEIGSFRPQTEIYDDDEGCYEDLE